MRERNKKDNLINAVKEIYKGNTLLDEALIYDNIPLSLRKLGIKNIPMYMDYDVIGSLVLNINEAKLLNYSPDNKYYGLGKTGLYKIIEAFINPYEITDKNGEFLLVCGYNDYNFGEVTLSFVLKEINGRYDVSIYNKQKRGRHGRRN